MRASRALSRLLRARHASASFRRATSLQRVRKCRMSAPSVPKYDSPYLHVEAEVTHSLKLLDTGDTREVKAVPIYSIVDWDGKPVSSSFNIDSFMAGLGMTTEDLIRMYQTMIDVEIFDRIYYSVHRVGKTSFYMENSGEEACQVGTAAALQSQDVLFFQYRELGSFLWRGLTFQEAGDLNFSNARGHGSGRQMPVHYGKKDANCVTVSSTLATQMPQASGAGYAMKRSKTDPKGVVVCYFGDGAASEGDAHAAFNMSATLSTPNLWICRNNGFAISTPHSDQYRGDGIAARSYGYGMYAARVDGGDLLATLEMTAKARELIVKEQRPVMLECMCWRGSHHSTSDESSRYRSKEEERFWKNEGSPLIRTKNLLCGLGLWNEEKEEHYREKVEELVTESAEKAEDCPFPPFDNLFKDVYDELTPELQRQKAELYRHLKAFEQDPYYALDKYILPSDF